MRGPARRPDGRAPLRRGSRGATRPGEVPPDAHPLSEHDPDARRRRLRTGEAQGAFRRADLLFRSARVHHAARVDAAIAAGRRDVRRRTRGRDAAAGAPRVRRPARVGAEPDVAARGPGRAAHRAGHVWRLRADAVSRVGSRPAQVLQPSAREPAVCVRRDEPRLPVCLRLLRGADSPGAQVPRAQREVAGRRDRARLPRIRHRVLLPVGDTVPLNVKTFSAFCDELVARNLPIRWFGNARADNLTDPAFVHRLRKAGCWMLAMGIETESEEIRKDMVKRLERAKIQTALRNMRYAGIRSFAFFIFGYPGETLAPINQTIDYAIALDPDFANFYPAVPYPGTALYDKVVKDGLLVVEDWTRMEHSYYLLKGNGLDEH